MSLRSRVVDRVFDAVELVAALLDLPRRLRALHFPGYRRQEDEQPIHLTQRRPTMVPPPTDGRKVPPQRR